MGCVRDTKGHEQVFDFVSIVHANAIGNAFDPHVGWILEKGDRWTTLEDRLEEGYLTCMRLEDAGR